MAPFFSFPAELAEAPAWYAGCRRQLLEGFPQDALQTASEAVAEGQRSGQRSSEAAAQYAVAQLHLMNSEPKKARAAGEEAVKLFKELGDRKQEAAALHTLIRARVELKQLPAAAQQAQEALSQRQDDEDLFGQAIALLTLAEVRFAERDSILALQAGEEARATAREAGADEVVVAAVCVLAQINLSRGAAGDAEDAQRLVVAEGGLFQKVGGNVGEAFALLLTSEANFSMGQHRTAAQKAKQAAELFQRHGERRQQARALHVAAAAAIEAGLLDEGRRNATGALALCRQLRDARGEAAAACMVADVHLAKEDYEQAVWRAAEGQKVFLQKGDLELVGSAGLTIAIAHVARIAKRRSNSTQAALVGWADEALAAALGAREAFQSRGNVVGQAAALNQLARALLAKGQHGEAFAAIAEAQQLCSGAGDTAGEAEVLLTKARVHFETGGVAEAMQCAGAAQAMFKSSGDERGQLSAYEVAESFRESPEFEALEAKGGAGAAARNLASAGGAALPDISGHRWGRAPSKRPLGFGSQFVRFIGMRGRPAANMKVG